MTLDSKTHGRRTLLFEEGMHVATIMEIAAPKGCKPGFYQWYVASNGGRADSYEEALGAVEVELAR